MVPVLFLLSLFFSGAETAVVSANRMRLESFLRNGNRRAGRAIFILDNIEDAVGMLLIGNNIANIASTAFITYIGTKEFMLNEQQLVGVTVIQTVIFLIFCEVTPKVIARSKSEKFLMFFSYPVIMLMIIFKPFNKVSLFFAKMVKKAMKVKESRNLIVRSKDELDFLFKLGHKEGLFYEDHQVYVSEILSFKDLRAIEIITPTVDIISISLDGTLKKLVEIIDNSSFSRIPVYRDRVDNIIGYIFYRDILKKKGIRSLSEIMTRPYYIPSSKNIFELYQEMYENSIPIVFVVNEHGGVVGMITKEDIAEEVVGEIQTSDHHEGELIMMANERKYILSGDLDIEYFQRYFSIPVEKKGFETIAGFMSYHLRKIPKKGDRLRYGNCTFIVDEATERSVEKIIILLDEKNGKP